MGEIADMMLSGVLCAQCGVTLQCAADHGFPILCDDCYSDLSKGDRECNVKESDYPTTH